MRHHAAFVPGQTFGSLTIVVPATPSPCGSNRWLCVCRCGALCTKNASDLRRAERRGVGCPACARLSCDAAHRKHGEANVPLHKAWMRMRSRCQVHPHYAGRGIQVCAEWDNYPAFRAWALAHAYEVGLSIDRIDPAGHYEPGNCRWIPFAENARLARLANPHQNKGFVHLDGSRASLKEIAHFLAVKQGTLRYWFAEAGLYA